MGWDVGYMGDCPNCGEHLHQFSEDKPRMTAMWLRCPTCLRADSILVEDGTEARFWSEAHPCPRCSAERQQWNASRCPRCGQADAGRFYCMPD